MNEPAVSIVVVNWNVRELLGACLRSIDRHSDASVCEVIVVDNASTDGSAEMVRNEHPDVTLIVNEENVGFGRANNQALGVCRGEHILLLNPDAELLEGALEALLLAMRSDEAVAVAGARLLNPDGSFQRGCGGAFPTLANVAQHCLRLDWILPRGLRAPSLFFDEAEADRRPMEWVSGGAMMIRRSALEDAIFDERFFMYGEDLELCSRLTGMGRRVVFVGDARVMHHMRASLRRQTSDDVYAAFVKGPREFYRMHHGAMQCALYDGLVLAGFVLRWIGFSALAAIRPGSGRRERASDARRSAAAALRIMWSS